MPITIAIDRKITQSVLELVETVGRLETDDQERILRIVTLLALAPRRVQARSQKMLRQLLASKPATASDCIEQVDELIDFLEEHIDTLESVAHDLPGAAERRRYN